MASHIKTDKPLQEINIQGCESYIARIVQESVNMYDGTYTVNDFLSTNPVLQKVLSLNGHVGARQWELLIANNIDVIQLRSVWGHIANYSNSHNLTIKQAKAEFLSIASTLATGDHLKTQTPETVLYKRLLRAVSDDQNQSIHKRVLTIHLAVLQVVEAERKLFNV